MSMIGEIQVRNMYVGGDFPEHATISALRAGANLDLACLQPSGVAIANNSEFVLALKNHKGEVTLSDVVNPKRVTYATSKSFAARSEATETVSGFTVVANKLYSITVNIAGFGSLSVEDEYIKEGFYKSKTGDTEENIVDGLIQSLARNFSRENPTLNTTSTLVLKGGATTVQIKDNATFAFTKESLDGTAEISTIVVTAAATAAGTATVDLDGVTIDLPLTDSTIAINAGEIAAAIDALPLFSAVSDGVDTVTITALYEESQVDIASYAAGTATTSAATLATPTPGVNTTLWGVKITEKNWLPTYYVTGKKDRLSLMWRVNNYSSAGIATQTRVVGTEGSGTGYQVRNMEYYFLGNREDSFRGMGYPHNFDAVYNSSLTAEYQILEIGYYDEGRDDAQVKSKKQITVVFEAVADMNLLIAEINKSLLATGIIIPDVA